MSDESSKQEKDHFLWLHPQTNSRKLLYEPLCAPLLIRLADKVEQFRFPGELLPSLAGDNLHGLSRR